MEIVKMGSQFPKIRSTTVIAVKRDGKVAMAGDGQVTLGDTVSKGNARKVRKIYDGKILTGFAGSVADAFTLLDKFETKIKEFNGDLTRAAVELAKRPENESKNIVVIFPDTGNRYLSGDYLG